MTKTRKLMSIEEARAWALLGYPIRRAAWTVENEGITWTPVATTSHSTATDLFTLSSHGFVDGQLVIFSTSGTLPTAVIIPPTGAPGSPSGSTIDLSDYAVVVRVVTSSTFGLKAAGAAGLLVDLTVAGSGTIYVKRATKRRWLSYDARAKTWWLDDGDTVRLARATDLSADDFDAADWTVLSEEEMLDDSLSVFVSPPAFGDPFNPPEPVDPVSIVPPVEAAVPPATGTFDTTGGGSVSGGASGGTGGSLQGGGNRNSSSGDGGSGGGAGLGDLGSGSGGSSGGGGGGSGGGGGDTSGGGAAAQKIAKTPTINLTYSPNYKLLWSGGVGFPGMHDARVSGQVSLESFDPTLYKGRADDLFFVSIFMNGRKVWNRTMKWGDNEGWTGKQLNLSGAQGIVMIARVSGPSGINSDTKIEPPSD